MENFAHKSTPRRVTYAILLRGGRIPFKTASPLPLPILCALRNEKEGWYEGKRGEIRKNKIKPLLGSILKWLFSAARFNRRWLVRPADVVPPSAPITRICLATARHPSRVRMKTPMFMILFQRTIVGNWKNMRVWVWAESKVASWQGHVESGKPTHLFSFKGICSHDTAIFTKLCRLAMSSECSTYYPNRLHHVLLENKLFDISPLIGTYLHTRYGTFSS